MAVASNFHAAFEALRPHFIVPTEAAYGSSGLLYAQIVQGRPFDLFLSADGERPLALVASGQATDAAVYARGILVLVVHAGSPGPGWLDGGARVAMANPATAPYGRAAREVLDALNANTKVVNAMNVAQAFHFWASGGADGAFVGLAQAKSQAISAERYWIVPRELHAPIEQVAVVLDGPRQAEARDWLWRLLSDPAQRVIQSAGYRAPGPSSAAAE